MKSGAAEMEAVAARLRTRVSERRYPEAQCALQAYCQALRKTVAGLAPCDPSVLRLENEWNRLLGETQRRMLANRAHAAARLARLPKPLPGYGTPAPPRHTWEFSG